MENMVNGIAAAFKVMYDQKHFAYVLLPFIIITNFLQLKKSNF